MIDLRILDKLVCNRRLPIWVYKIDGEFIASVVDKHSQTHYPNGSPIKDNWPFPAFIIKPKKK